jgi:hypothetical protein
MAEFALGLTKTAVEGTLSRVKSAIEEEAKLKVKVQHDLVFITGEFQMMQSFLNVANKERTQNEVVRTWVRQLQELAFDVEDCVEFVVHLDNKSAWSWAWRMVPSCLAPPRHLDQAISDLKQLKARVEDVSQRNTRYNLISDSGSNSKPAEQPSLATNRGASAFQLLTDVWKAMGKWRGIGNLESLVNSEGQELQVISVWGCGDAHLGAASIFRKVYNDPQIRQDFKCRAWVNIMRPFCPNEFLKTLLTQFYASTQKENDGANNITKAELMQQVKEHKYLIILEELSSAVEWDAIKMYLPDNKNGSRIIVLTKQLGISVLCTGEPYQVSELGLFSDK